MHWWCHKCKKWYYPSSDPNDPNPCLAHKKDIISIRSDILLDYVSKLASELIRTGRTERLS
jgi:hypothetical protein